MFRRLLQVGLLVCATPLAAEPGVTDQSVSFAQIAALQGPASALGVGMQSGILAAFEEVNRAGGVHGRRLVLDAFDDRYEPEQTVSQMQTLLEENRHLGLIGTVGTPTTQAIQPLAAQAGLPVIAPFTGAASLRAIDLSNVVNVRASYDQETERWVQFLADEKGLSRIALLYQDDAFGRAGQSGVQAAMERRGLKLVAEATYLRNTVAVKSALLDIRNSGAEAVVMVGTYQPVAEFVRLSRKLKFAPVFMTISFVGTDALVGELSAEGAGVIVSQVVPFPQDQNNPFVLAYQAALAASDPAAVPGFVSLEGYIAGRLVIEALQKTGPNVTRESFLNTIRGLRRLDLNGLALTFGVNDNQGLDDVFLTVISDDGQIAPLGG